MPRSGRFHTRRKHRWFRFRAVLACVPAAGLALLATTGAAAAAPAPVSTRAQIRAALEHLLAHWNPTNQPAGPRARHGPGLAKVTSTNWSGYVDDNSKGNTYTYVTAWWKQPKVTCKASTVSWVVFWVGLDGFGSGTVEQDGSMGYCPGGGSTTPVYATWWEMWPSNTIQVVGTSVTPTDKISGTVIKTGSSYQLQVIDAGNPANTFLTTQTCPAATCTGQSAEWIAETPTNTSTGGLYPLANFNYWTLRYGHATSGGKYATISTFPNDQITMKDSANNVMAQPGALTGGDQFVDTWKRSV
jgi:hypothetical protein